MEEQNVFENPIDKNKITINPGALPYAHTVGSFKIEPTKKGQIKGQAMAAMEEQADLQLAQIQQQVELLAAQARKIQQRVEVSRTIYNAEMGFQPIIGECYYLYQKKPEQYILSIVAPQEWRKNIPYDKFVAFVRLLADHTWEVLD